MRFFWALPALAGLLALGVAPPAVSAQPQYESGGEFNGCIRVLYDPAEYYYNDCGVALHITYCSPDPSIECSSMDVPVGGKGHIVPMVTRTTRDYYGNPITFNTYICREGYQAVTADDLPVNGASVTAYRCKLI